jgi:hypothetical protein
VSVPEVVHAVCSECVHRAGSSIPVRAAPEPSPEAIAAAIKASSAVITDDYDSPDLPTVAMRAAILAYLAVDGVSSGRAPGGPWTVLASLDGAADSWDVVMQRENEKRTRIDFPWTHNRREAEAVRDALNRVASAPQPERPPA